MFSDVQNQAQAAGETKEKKEKKILSIDKIQEIFTGRKKNPKPKTTRKMLTGREGQFHSSYTRKNNHLSALCETFSSFTYREISFYII